MATYKELMDEAQQLLAQAEELRRQERAQVVAEIRAQMATYGLTPADVTSGFRAKRQAAPGRKIATRRRVTSPAPAAQVAPTDLRIITPPATVD